MAWITISRRSSKCSTNTGDLLNLSTKTVANNVSNILNKLHLVNRSEAIVRARDAGLGNARRETSSVRHDEHH